MLFKKHIMIPFLFTYPFCFMTYILIGSDDGLSSIRYQAILIYYFHPSWDHIIVLGLYQYWDVLFLEIQYWYWSWPLVDLNLVSRGFRTSVTIPKRPISGKRVTWASCSHHKTNDQLACGLKIATHCHDQGQHWGEKYLFGRGVSLRRIDQQIGTSWWILI